MTAALDIDSRNNRRKILLKSCKNSLFVLCIDDNITFLATPGASMDQEFVKIETLNKGKGIGWNKN